AAQGQGPAARHLAGGDEGGGREGVRPVRGDLPGEVRQGDGLPDQGPGRVAGLLRLPGGALGASAHDQPDRIDVRHGAVADGQDEGERVEGRLPDDGVQADGGGLEDLAVAGRGTVAVEGHRRGVVCRWGGANRSRLTQPPSTTFDNCSPQQEFNFCWRPTESTECKSWHARTPLSCSASWLFSKEKQFVMPRWCSGKLRSSRENSCGRESPDCGLSCARAERPQSRTEAAQRPTRLKPPSEATPDRRTTPRWTSTMPETPRPPPRTWQGRTAVSSPASHKARKPARGTRASSGRTCCSWTPGWM